MSSPPTSPLIGWGHHRLHPTRASSLIIPQDMSEGEDETSSVSAIHASSPSSAGGNRSGQASWQMCCMNVCEISLRIRQFHRNITTPQRQEREETQVPSFVDSGESLSANFRCRRQHSVMFRFFGDHRKEENWPLHRRRQRIINRSHLSFVSTPECVNTCEV